MKLLLVASCLVSVVFLQVMVNAVRATTRLPSLLNPQALGTNQYITVTGCNNDCDIACCYCDIRKQPPICVQCCQEGR